MPKRLLSGVIVSAHSKQSLWKLLKELGINFIKRLLKEQKNIMLMMKIMNIKLETKLLFKNVDLFQKLKHG